MSGSSNDYASWSTEQLISRVSELETRLAKLTASATSASSSVPPPSNSSAPPAPPPTTSLSGSEKRRLKKALKDASNGGPKAFDRNRYSTRFIALKFAYLGQRYNGLEYHANNTTPLPTVEEELWRALWKTRLILPEGEAASRGEVVDWTGCEYSKCGRTDKGVSAFGQVVALKVRSARPVGRRAGLALRQRSLDTAVAGGPAGKVAVESEALPEQEAQVQCDDEPPTEESFDPVKDELPYIQMLNRVLPDDIRVLAWCDPPEGFSARFSCTERRYRYFFTNPAYAPVPGDKGMLKTVDGKPLREGCLDIEAMQDAAKRLEGLHDFRNFCKIEGARQIENYRRRIAHASIEEIDPSENVVGYVSGKEFQGGQGGVANGRSGHETSSAPKLFTFNVYGSAFLWHQVRNMVAILFLVGQGLESPSVVSDLLDVETTPTRPKYEMAADAPLVLWDCIFDDLDDRSKGETLNWHRVGDEAGGRDNTKKSELEGGDGKFGRNGIMDSLWSTWRRRKIDEVLAGSLVDLVAKQGRQSSLIRRSAADEAKRSTRVFDGSDQPRAVGPYVPIMKKARQEHYEVINARFREKNPGSVMNAAKRSATADE